jgi:hypothetical protein
VAGPLSPSEKIRKKYLTQGFPINQKNTIDGYDNREKNQLNIQE